MIQAVIQAGGKGTRLAAITKNEIPKPMVDVAGKPLIQWQIEELKKNNVHSFIIIVGHLGNIIKDYCGDGSKWGVSIKYIEEKESDPLGTAGALAYLPALLQENEFIFVYADVFFSLDVERMLSFHRQHKSEATLLIHPNSHPFDSDLVLTDKEYRVLSFQSKHDERQDYYQNQVNAGFFIFNKSVCSNVPEPCKLAIEKDILSGMLQKGCAVYGYRSTEYIKDMGTVARLKNVEADIKSGFVFKRNLHNQQKAIFIDRDGTLNKYVGLLSTPKQLELENGVSEALLKVNSSEYLAICCTNQPVVARGMCSIDELELIHKKLQTLLGNKGVFLDDIIYCPHHPDKGYPGEVEEYKVECNCRKPGTAMLEEMSQRYNIDLRKSWFVGDTTTDIQTAVNSGMRSVLVMTGEAGRDEKFAVCPDIKTANLKEAVTQILKMGDKL